VDVYW
jgi:hypothetical protein